VDWKGSISRDDMSPTLASTAFQPEAPATELATLTQLTETAQPLVQVIASEVVGQIQRYMGCVQNALLAPGQGVEASSSPRRMTCGSDGTCP
jgi:hypothetical protein